MKKFLFAWLTWALFSFPAGAQTKTCPQILATQASQPQTFEDHWRAVGLKFELLRTMVNHQTCYSNDIAFHMCIAAINFLLRQGKPALRLAPSILWSEFGMANLEPIADTEPPGETAPEFYARMAKEFREQREVWNQVYAIRSHLEFDRLLNHARRFIALKEESLFTGMAFNAAFATIDPHSRLEPELQWNSFHTQDREELVGIGVHIGVSPRAVYIEDVLPGGPAATGGLEIGDVIVKVDGRPVAPNDVDSITERVQGLAGSEVKIEILRGDKAMIFTFNRRKVALPNVDSRYYPDEKLGLIRLTSFMSAVAAVQVGSAITSLEQAGAKGLILDLRGNPGGLTDNAVDIASHFLGPDRPVMLQRFLEAEPGQQNIMHATDGPRLTNLPLIVLVDRRSASASELLAGILQDTKRAFIVGERTYGKGTMQIQRAVGQSGKPFGGYKVVLLQTVAMFHTPSGRSNQIHGITPDFEVYRVLDPTEAHKFAVREGDRFPNAIANPQKPFEQNRQELVKAIEACLAKQARARTVFEGKAPSELPLDHQLLHAADVLRCWRESLN